MADPDYQKKFGVGVQKVLLREIHGKVRPANWVPEFEHLIVETDSMSRTDWQRMQVYSWLVMVLHGMKVGFFVLTYLFARLGVRYRDILSFLINQADSPSSGQVLQEEIAIFWQKTEMILKGEGRGCVLEEYGDLYWDEEEASFLRISERTDLFLEQFHVLVSKFLHDQGIVYDPQELTEAFRYQKMRMPVLSPPDCLSTRFEFNLPEYFDTILGTDPPCLQKKPQTFTISPVDFAGDKKRFAREVLLWGRKSDRILVNGKQSIS